MFQMIEVYREPLAASMGNQFNADRLGAAFARFKFDRHNLAPHRQTSMHLKHGIDYEID